MSLKAYEGNENYAFVSYAHKDKKQAMPVLKKLAENGCRLWYDEGIAPGSEFPDDIAQHLDRCALCIALLTPACVASLNCRNEINYALSEGKPFLGIMLEPTEMPAGMKLQLSTRQCILRHNFPSDEAFWEKILTCDILKLCQGGEVSTPLPPPRPWKKMLLAAVMAAAVGLGVLIGGDGNTPAEEEPVKEETVAASIELPAEELPAPQPADAVPELSEPEGETEPAEGGIDVKALALLRAGDTVSFGRYEQDDKDADFDEEIEWLVLEKKDNTLLLLSKNLLDCRPYYEEYLLVTWRGSELRKWLNEVFYENAFSGEEKELIARSSLRNRKNPSYGTLGGEDTEDKVFLLSLDEVTEYFERAEDRRCKPSDFAYNEAASKDAAEKAWWWVRTPGKDGHYALGVMANGEIQHGGYQVANDGYVRPVIRIELN